MVVVLPAPFGPRKPVTLPCIDGKAQVVHRQDRPEPFGEVPRFDHLLACSSCRSWGRHESSGPDYTAR